MREGYRTAVERQSEVLVASFLEELETLGLRENTVVRVPLRPRRVVGRALRGQGGREGRLPHARRDALRRDRRGAADPLGARAARARASSSRRCARSTSCRRSSSSPGCRRARRDGESLLQRRRRPAGDDRGHRHGRAHEARRPQAAVEADPRRRERGGGGVPARRRPARARQPRRRTRRPSSARSSSASSRAPSGTS